ncbi:hypothetical protein FRC06_005471, partial [Ceratobasidium sp. 370]
FFDTILRQTPDTVWEVIIGKDNEWHSTDGKYGSTGNSQPPQTNNRSTNSDRRPIEIDSDESDVEVLSSNVRSQVENSPIRVKDEEADAGRDADTKCMHQ